MAGTLVITTLSDGTNSTSSTNAISGSAKAWVALSLNGAAATIQKSYNVTSLTYVTTGQFNVNFTAGALPDANYAVVGSASWDSGDGNAVCSVGAKGSGTKTTSVCACSITYGGTYLNSSRASVAFFD